MELTSTEIKQLYSIEKVIDKAKGKLTLAEITAETALPIDDARSLLNVLLERYNCRVNMDSAQGNIVFNFEYPLKRRDAKSFKEIAVKVGTVLWKGFQIVYKASLGVLLIVYTSFFVLVLIALFLRNSDDSDDNNVSDLVFGIFRAIFEALQFKAMMDMTTDYVQDGDYYYKQYRKPENKGKGFIQSVFHFVFGPERPEYDPISDSLEAIAFIRQNNGKLNAGQIITLTGADYDTAESKLAEYAGKFAGELYIDENGVVTGEFHQLMHSTNSQLKGGKIEYYKNEIEPPVEFTGNTAGRNTAIIAMNLFNLIMSVMVVAMFEGSTIGIFAGILPLLISVLYFLIPILRIPSYFKNKRNRKYSKLRKKIIGLISEYSASALKKNDLYKILKNDEANESDIDAAMSNICAELQGEVNLNENSEAVYQFNRLARELGK